MLLAGRGIVGIWLTSGTHKGDVRIGGFPQSSVTFDLHLVLVGAWQKVKGEAMAVDEAENTSAESRAKDNKGVKWVWL